MKALLTAGFAVFFLAVTTVAPAAIAFITVTPALTQVAPGGDATIYLTWRIKSGQAPESVVNSAQGRFVVAADGRILATNPQSIGAKTDLNDQIALVRETLTVPAELLSKMQAAGLNRIVYEREFADGDGRAKGICVLQLDLAMQPRSGD